MKTLIIMMVLAMLNGTPSEKITYYDYSEEVTFELIDAYIVDMETGEKTPLNVTVLEAD